jgi:hypothetical protein
VKSDRREKKETPANRVPKATKETLERLVPRGSVARREIQAKKEIKATKVTLVTLA